MCVGGNGMRRRLCAFCFLLLCPLWGHSVLIKCCASKLEDALPHAGASWAESLRSLGTAARSLLAKVLLDRQTRKVGYNVLGRLKSLGLTARRPAIRRQKEGLCN